MRALWKGSVCNMVSIRTRTSARTVSLTRRVRLPETVCWVTRQMTPNWNSESPSVSVAYGQSTKNRRLGCLASSNKGEASEAKRRRMRNDDAGHESGGSTLELVILPGKGNFACRKHGALARSRRLSGGAFPKEKWTHLCWERHGIAILRGMPL